VYALQNLLLVQKVEVRWRDHRVKSGAGEYTRNSVSNFEFVKECVGDGIIESVSRVAASFPAPKSTLLSMPKTSPRQATTAAEDEDGKLTACIKKKDLRSKMCACAFAQLNALSTSTVQRQACSLAQFKEECQLKESESPLHVAATSEQKGLFWNGIQSHK
jgi:hypothetical protein